MRLLRDPDLDESPAAKKAVIRQLGESEARRDRLNARLGELLDGANHNSGKSLRAVRKALAEAEETLMNIRTPAQMNRLVADLVGKASVDKDGNLSCLEPSDDGSWPCYGL